MTTLNEVLDPALLHTMLNEGYVRRQVHPDYPLAILNYTEKAQYDNAWNAATLTCRGLIFHTDTNEVLARPFRKFFNYGQPGAPTIGLESEVVVTDKIDGSLGIIYPYPDGSGYGVATRGSFTSDQALHATEKFRMHYSGWVNIPPGLTVLCEIVYPQNRIVVDYADRDELVLLGAVDIEDGVSYSPELAAEFTNWYPAPVTDTFKYATLAEALAAAPRPNAEGLVVHAVVTDERVKVKQEDYVALHRIVTGLNARTVWQHLGDGKPLDDLIEPLPDEFHPWVREVATQLDTETGLRAVGIEAAYQGIVADLPDGWSRKDFALIAKDHPERAALFLRLDGRDYKPALWLQAKPEASWNPSGRSFTEDAA